MKKVLFVACILLFSLQGFSQLLSWTPGFPVESTASFTITMDASKGNQGLLNYTPVTDVYVHTGVITNQSTSNSDWKHVKFNQNFNQPNPSLQAVSRGNNKWQFTISGGIRAYYGLTDPTEVIQKIAILFRSGDGTKKQANADGSDMYIPLTLTPLDARFIVPFIQPTFTPQPETITKNTGDTIAVTGISNVSSALQLYFNGSVIQIANNATTISANPVITVGGNQTLVLEANDGTNIKKDTITFFVNGGVTTAPLPAGVRDGINYGADNTSATLVLYAPGKSRVSIIGEFSGSNWMEQSQYQMNKTPDGNYWWLTINGLTPGTEYAFQYLVDGTLKIAEPYCQKILDPNNDQYISPATYPALKPYPVAVTTGIVSILQTNAPAYTWQVNNFQKPDKKSLVIYELLLRDFVANHNWNTLRDTLSYLKKLGINAIEIMPFNEFEGNNSWGYNPDFYFAPDKYYGPANTLKEFIDSCHKDGIAVIMDMVLNHSFGSSPMVQLYFDAVNNRPAADNPWFNPVPKHAYNVGYDMNHESLATRYFVSRVVDHWLNNYKIDGFRFDLSKGFTQTQTCDNNGNNCNVSAWGNYDQTRVDIWKRYYDTIELKSPGSYAILEHFADNSEEKVLSAYGLMLWGNMNYNYNQASMGYTTDWDFSYGLASQRGWSDPYLVTYMESHDEERLMYKNLQYGNSSGSYKVQDTATALKRNELAAAFFFTLPGPKIIWQFGELGYDYSINYCQDGTNNGNCRTDPKPIRWDYLQQPARIELHDVYSALIKLRFNSGYEDAFISNTSQQDLSSAFKWIKLTGATGKIVVIGNFDVVPQTGSVTFPDAGTWFDYLNGTTITATGAAQSFTLAPGEYHVYTITFVSLPVKLVSFSGKNYGANNLLTWNVANEQDLQYYELQRSDDGQHFYSLSKINAAGKSKYSFTDNISGSALPIYYYRLKMVDQDGNFTYSSIIKIKAASASLYISIHPNPFHNKLIVAIQSSLAAKVNFTLTDFSGRQLYRQTQNLSAGDNTVVIKETEKLSAGTYLLTVAGSLEHYSFKVIKDNN